MQSSSRPQSRVQLFVSCRNLMDKDVLSKSDPICVLEMKQAGSWVVIGRTEYIRNNLNPNFTKSFIVDYFFEETQHLRFKVYDVDNESSTLEDDDFLGEAAMTMADIIGSRGQVATRPLMYKGRTEGQISVRAEELTQSNQHVSMQFVGIKLDKKDFFGKSDPYVNIYRQQPDGSFSIVHKTEVVMKTLDPVWAPINKSMTELCNNDVNRKLKFECFDWDKNSDHDYIGEFETTVADIMAGRREFVFTNMKKGKPAGRLQFTRFDVRTEPSFLDYLAGGCEISLMVAIDFTGSNGNPTDPRSLHYAFTNGQLNEYETAIRAVGDILSYYDTDKLFPAFGFGAKLPNGVVSHCFALNGNPDNPECARVEGILAAYRQALNNVSLYGPTNFATVISTAAQIAREYANPTTEQKYHILLIITDGVITDMDATIREIVQASSLPLSIVIVGVGNEDFSKMEHLDGDDRALRSGGATATRDIVQFVAFRDFRGKPYEFLAKAVLEEIPKQLLQFFKSKNIPPNARIQIAGPPAMGPSV